MKIQSSKFRELFDRVKDVACKRTTLPILNCVKMESKDGQLVLSATDLECYVRASTEHQDPIKPFCVDAKLISFLIPSLDTEMELTIEKKRLHIKSEYSNSQIPILDAEEFVDVPKIGTEIGLNTHDLSRSLRVGWSALVGGSRFPLEALYIKTTPTHSIVVCHDGPSVAFVKSPAICGESEFMVHANSEGILKEALEHEDSSLFVGDNWVSVTSGDCEIHLKRLEGKYVDILPHLEKPVEKIGVIPKASIIGHAETMKSMFQNLIVARLEFTKSKLTMSIKDSERSFSAEIPGRFNERTMALTPHRLHALLASMPDEELEFGFAHNGLHVRAGYYVAMLASCRVPE